MFIVIHRKVLKVFVGLTDTSRRKMKREDWETEPNKHQEKEQGKVGLMTELNREKAKLPWSNKEEKKEWKHKENLKGGDRNGCHDKWQDNLHKIREMGLWWSISGGDTNNRLAWSCTKSTGGSERTAEKNYLIWFCSLSSEFGSLDLEMEKKVEMIKDWYWCGRLKS